MVGESFLTHRLFPRGQGREDAGFGASHGHGAGIPVLVPSGCIWTAEKCRAEVRAWVPAAARLCSPWRATMLLGHAGNAPESRGGSDAATPGAPHHTVLYTWPLQWITLPMASTGTLWIHTSICEQCLSLCLEKKGENILILPTLVWVLH